MLRWRMVTIVYKLGINYRDKETGGIAREGGTAEFLCGPRNSPLSARRARCTLSHGQVGLKYTYKYMVPLYRL